MKHSATLLCAVALGCAITSLQAAPGGAPGTVSPTGPTATAPGVRPGVSPSGPTVPNGPATTTPNGPARTGPPGSNPGVPGGFNPDHPGSPRNGTYPNYTPPTGGTNGASNGIIH